MEQRYDAVSAVIRDGYTVSEVAQAYGSPARASIPGWPVMKKAASPP